MRSRRLRRGLLMAAITCAVVAGCSDFDRAGFLVENQLAIPIDVFYIRGDRSTLIIDDLTPGLHRDVNGIVGGSECRSETMVAKDQSGTVLATFPGPVCDGMTWVVGPSPGP